MSASGRESVANAFEGANNVILAAVDSSWRQLGAD